MTVSQLDQLQKIARKLTVAALAVGVLGQDDGHQAVEEALIDIAAGLRALADVA
jgi:hypothetical protein